MRPCLLIASPQMRDPFFEKTVVLVYHHDEHGAVGVVINRPLEHRLADVLADELDLDVLHAERTSVTWGGPVESGSGTVVARTFMPNEEDAWQVNDKVVVTRSIATLRQLLAEGAELMLCLGYAGWEAGQLDREIEEAYWLYTDADPAILFDADPEHRYLAALGSLGLTPVSVWMQPIQE